MNERQARNIQLAQALLRDGVLDEASLRQVMQAASGKDLATYLIDSKRLSREVVERALGRPASRVYPKPPANDGARRSDPPAGAS